MVLNAVFADGSTRTLNENMNYKIYRYLMTTDNKRSNNPDNTSTQLDDIVNETDL